MTDKLKVDALEFYVLPGKCAPKAYQDKYNSTYACWKKLWDATFQKEFQLDEELYSNDFSRQDEVLALFYENQCVGLCCLRIVDFREEATLADNYFRKWPEISRARLRSYGDRTVICSNLTLSYEFRKGYLGVSWKDLLSTFAVQRFLQLDCDSMAAAVRRRRGMDKATYQVGFRPIFQDLPYLGEESVDLVVCFKDTVETSCFGDLVNEIYARAIILTTNHEHVAKEVKHAA